MFLCSPCPRNLSFHNLPMLGPRFPVARNESPASLSVDRFLLSGRVIRSSKGRDHAHVGAAVIAHGAEHPPLQLPKGHAVEEPADVHFGVVGAIRIAANDKHMFSTVASHVAQPRGLIVKHQVRDRPGHRLSKCERGHRQIIQWDGSRTGHAAPDRGC
jgi:hypothetical protein